MSGLIEAYNAPSGELTSENIDQVQAALQRQIVILQALCGRNAEAIGSLCSVPGDCNIRSGLDPFSGLRVRPFA